MESGMSGARLGRVEQGGVLLQAAASPSLVSCPAELTWLPPSQHILVAQRQVQVVEEALQDFHRALSCYVDFTEAQSHCLQ